MTSDLEIASLHLFPNALAAALTKDCSESTLAFIVDVAGLVSGRGPELPFVTCIRSSLLHLSGFIFEPGSELQFVTPASSPKDVSGLVSGNVFEPNSRFVDVSGLVSGLESEPGSELPFATTLDQIEPRGCLWSRC